MKKVLSGLAVVGAAGMATHGFADQYHYNNIIVGDRAMGLGGAYCAVADDASGVVYNPAGLAFSLSNDVQGSATAFSSKRVEYLKTIGDDSFVESSAGKTGPFVGGLQKLDHIVPGMIFAFGLWTSDAELKDQNDVIVVDGSIPRFHRAVNLKASTDYIGVAVAKRFSSKVALGMGINYATTDELLQEYQDAVTYVKSGETVYEQILTQNIRQRLTASALEFSPGLQFVTGRVSVGMMIKIPVMLGDQFENNFEQTIVVRDPSTGAVASTLSEEAKTRTERPKRDDLDPDAIEPAVVVEDAIKQWPAEYRFGAAMFWSTNVMTSFDVVHRSATDGEVNQYDREAVTNFSLGTEYYATSSLPIRLGFMTNKDARETPEEGKTDQRDSIDFNGMSLFAGWVQPNSSLSFGVIHQQGSGKAQKLARSKVIQEVKGSSTMFAYSAVVNF